MGHEVQSSNLVDQAYRIFTRSPTPDWITFFRETLGINGLVRRTFSVLEERIEFERTEKYEEILLLLARLQERPSSREDPKEPIRVITVRVPKSVHEWLRVEAFEHQTSLNKLCISKLLQPVDEKFIPKGAWKSKSSSLEVVVTNPPNEGVEDEFEEI